MADTFRKEYKKLSETSSALIHEIKNACEMVEALIRNVSSREASLALTNLEQAAMWATKAVVLEDEKTCEKPAE